MTPRAIVRAALDRWARHDRCLRSQLCQEYGGHKPCSGNEHRAHGDSGGRNNHLGRSPHSGPVPVRQDAEAVQEEVYARLFGQNEEKVFGYQVVVNEHDQVEDLDERFLIGATTLNAEKVVRLIHDCHGLAVASHVDRAGFGIFSQLGFIPEGLQLDALEISKRADVDSIRKTFSPVS